MTGPTWNVTRSQAALAYLSIGHLPPASLLGGMVADWLKRRQDTLLNSAMLTFLASSIACVSFAMAASF